MPRVRRLRGELSHEELLRMRRMAKLHRVMRERGTPARVTWEETQEVMAHCRMLRDHGMSGSQISDACHGQVKPDTILSLTRGWRSGPGPGETEKVKSVLRTTYQVLMAVEPINEFDLNSWKGTPVDATGARRRLQALVADGFNYTYLGEQVCNDSNSSHVWKITSGRTEMVLPSMLARVKAVYDKLDGVKAEDMFTPAIAARTQRAGKKNGYAPRHTWDRDTIDNPAAFPEWTGKCGTYQGAHLHRKYKIYPVCKPCMEAASARRQELGYPSRERGKRER